MIHLTLTTTGGQAGSIVCGANKRDSVANGNLHYHAAQMPADRLTAEYRETDEHGRRHYLCLACLDISRATRGGARPVRAGGETDSYDYTVDFVVRKPRHR